MKTKAKMLIASLIMMAALLSSCNKDKEACDCGLVFSKYYEASGNDRLYYFEVKYDECPTPYKTITVSKSVYYEYGTISGKRIYCN